MCRTEARNIARHAVSTPNSTELAKFEAEQEDNLRQYVESNARILSLSEKSDEPGMWEKYAEHHKGICIGFRTAGESAWEEFFKNAYRVCYCDSLPLLSYYEDPGKDQNARRAFLYKTARWAHQKEWRLVSMRDPRSPEAHNDEDGREHFPGGMMSCVILGCRIPSPDRGEVLSWVALQPGPPRVFRADWEEGSPQLRLMPVTETKE